MRHDHCDLLTREQAKYKQSKNEANAAQNLLQKEITTLRDTNRTLQLKLRDIEVANDDFERQARNTTSSLEDLESKFNVAIERAVMMEEEIKLGEQERENLRIETQRLRDELSDLKIEADIMQGKLQKRQLVIATDISAPNSPSLAGSPTSTASSPLITTPPDTKSVSTTDTVSETPTPPSPPMSEASSTARPPVKTPLNPPKSKSKLPTADSSTTPKPGLMYQSANFRSSRGAGASSIPASTARGRNATPSVIRNTKGKAPPTRGMPNSNSLTHIRTLTAQMQRLEQRVQSARSKLPAPVNTPPKASPRMVAAMGPNYMPPSVTIRSRKRTTGSTASGSSIAGDDTPSAKPAGRLSTSGISRLSFGPLPNRGTGESSRPSSRASTSSYVRSDRPLSRTEMARPLSRTSMTGTRTPLGHYSQSTIAESRRPRSSVGGNFSASHGHGHSQSVSHLDLDQGELELGTPSRRSTLGKQDAEGSGIPAPSGLPRRKSGGLAMTPLPRRTSSAAALREDGAMKPPVRPRKLSGVGETY
jgi:hypothetical protein